MRHLALILIGILLTGCASAPRAPGAPVAAGPKAPGDQVVRGVGNLRKLLALPVVVQQGSCDWPDVARDLDEAAIRYLRDWKGYELVRPVPGDDGAWLLARQLGAWQEKDAGSGRPPAELRAKILVAAEGPGADGVLVIHASPECPGGADAGLLTLPARLAGSLNRTLSAGVYDAERGSLVWHQHIRPPGWDPSRYGARPPPRFETRQAGEALLAPIENAVPAVLKPVPRPRRPAPPPAPAATPTPPEVVVAPAREPTPLAPTPLPPVAAPAASGGATPVSGLPEAPATGEPATAPPAAPRPDEASQEGAPTAEPPTSGLPAPAPQAPGAPGEPESVPGRADRGAAAPPTATVTPPPPDPAAASPDGRSPPPVPELNNPEPPASPPPPTTAVPTPGPVVEPATQEPAALPPPAAAPGPALPPPEAPAAPREGAGPEAPAPVPADPAPPRAPIRT